MSPAPRGLIIAAPRSGSGKTPITLALLAALRRRGIAVRAGKSGPDYIDPAFHAAASGAPGCNLDSWAMPPALLDSIAAQASATSDIFIIESSMGLFDGIASAPGRTGASADLAARFALPVVLVLDVSGQSQSAAAVARGFATHDPRVRVAGVILNRVGSARHEEVLRHACAQVGVPVLGCLPRSAELELPSRHLGLVTAVEHGRRARVAVDAMAALVARHVDLAAVVDAAGSHVAGPAWDPAAAVGDTPGGHAIVAMAAGKAFSFSYAEHVELLRAAGAELVEFDPLTDTLPDGTGAVLLPGGFPEQFTAELSANDVVRRQIKELAAAGAPIHAECAGLIYLASELDGHPMCGVLAGSARFTPHLKLAYRDAVAVTDSSLYSVGQRVVGHEFHRTAVTFTDSYQPAWVYRGSDADHDAEPVRDGVVHAGVHASYLHTHPAAAPEAVVRFVAHAAAQTT